MSSRRPKPAPGLVLAAALAAACAATSATTRSEAEPITSEEAVESFDAAWTAIHETYYDADFNGVDWVALGDELRPRAAAAETLPELRAVIREMLASLDQSHFELLPEESLPPEGEDAPLDDVEGGLGLDFRFRDGRLIVSDVVPDSPSDAAGVRPGWSVVAIGDFEVAAALERYAAADEELDPRAVAYGMRQRALRRVYGPVGSEAALVVLDGSGTEHALELERAQRDAVGHRFGRSLPPMHLRFESELIDAPGSRVGRIHFTNWFLPMVQPLDRAVDDLRDSDGMIIDLRGNSGGVGAMVMGVAGHFVTERQELGVMHTRQSPMTIFANPRFVDPQGEPTEPFAGPVAILVDETTASASEIFAGGMQSIGRARVFGETSAGAVLPSRTTFLPNGDAILHAMGDFVTSDGILLEGRGVIPDEPVTLERADLLEGRDPQLEAAIAWIAVQTTERP